MSGCDYNLPPGVPCPALPWCGHEGHLPPEPDSAQLTIDDVLGEGA